MDIEKRRSLYKSARRWVCVEIDVDFILQIMVEGYRFDSRMSCKKGLPEGSRLVRIYEDAARNPLMVYCVFEHPSFSIVKEGERIPVFVPLYEYNVE